MNLAFTLEGYFLQSGEDSGAGPFIAFWKWKKR